MTTIRQIMPATGWRAVYVTVRDDDGSVEVREEPVMCFALLDPPYVERNDGPEQPVVPMMQDVFPPEFVITDKESGRAVRAPPGGLPGTRRGSNIAVGTETDQRTVGEVERRLGRRSVLGTVVRARRIVRAGPHAPFRRVATPQPGAGRAFCSPSARYGPCKG
jgi:hypothetical protein